MIMKTEPISKKVLLFIPVVALIVFTTGVAAHEEENVSVRVNAPEFVSGTFDVTIDIDDVIDLDNGQFDLSFDPDVLNANDVYEGEIDGTTVPIDMWRLIEEGRIRVLFNIEGVGAVSGSGYIVKIAFEVVGTDGDTSDLEISEELLSGEEPVIHPQYGEMSPTLKEIDADWSGDMVTVGNAGAVTTVETPVQTATPILSPSSLDSGAEPATTSTPSTEHVSDAAVPVGASENVGPDWWDVFVEHNFIGTYLFIGLLAFTYTLILLR